MTDITEAVALMIQCPICGAGSESGCSNTRDYTPLPTHDRRIYDAQRALGVVRDALNDPALREDMRAAVARAWYDSEDGAEGDITDRALAVVAARLGGDQ